MSTHTMFCVGILLGATGALLAGLYVLDRHRRDVRWLDEVAREREVWHVPEAWAGKDAGSE